MSYRSKLNMNKIRKEFEHANPSLKQEMINELTNHIVDIATDPYGYLIMITINKKA